MPEWRDANWQPGDFEEKMRKAMGGFKQRLRGARAVLILVALFIVVRILAGSMTIVPAGERAVVFSKFSGVLQTQLGEGFHVLIPWAWSVEKYNVRRQTWTVTVSEAEPGQSHASEDRLVALTKDGQTVTLDLSVVYHADPQAVWRLHQKVGPLYRDKIIRPQTRAICRMVVSQYAVTDVYSASREEIQSRIAEELGAGLKEWDIILDQLLLRNVMFSPEFQQAIEAKQVAIQEYERMQYELEAAEKTKEQTVIEAEGEAESLRLEGQALRANPLALDYEYARKIAPAVRAVVTRQATTPPVRPAAGGR